MSNRMTNTIAKLGVLLAALKTNLEPPVLAFMAKLLCDKANDADIDAALSRCAWECQYTVGLQDILQRLPNRQPDPGTALQVEAAAAFQAVIVALEREGVDFLALSDFPERTAYAVRQCGGLWHFNQRLKVRFGDDENPSAIEDRSYAFLQRDFVEAYKVFDVHHKAVLPALTEKGIAALPPKVRGFLTGRAESPADRKEPAAKAEKPGPKLVVRKVPEPLTPVELQDRREMLRQQAELLKARRERA